MSELKHIKGAAEIDRALKSLPAKVEANVVRAALRAGADVLKRSAQSGVPVKSGLLKGTLRVSTSRKGREIRAAVKAGDVKKRVFYAGMVERGTKSHLIKSSRGSVLTIGGGGFIRSVRHPGAKPVGFMAAALSQTGAALAAVIAKARERMAKLKVSA